MSISDPQQKPRATMLALAIVTACLLASCASCSKKSRVVDPGGYTGTVADLIAFVRRALPEGFVYPATLDSTASLLVTANVDGIGAASAAFRNGPSFTDAGTLTVTAPPPVDTRLVAEYSIPVSSTIQYVYTTYLTFPFDLPLVFDGAAGHVFHATGSPLIAAFDDTIVSVPLLELTAPQAGATIARANPVTVAWSPGKDGTVFVTASVFSVSDTTLHVAVALAQDPVGSLVIPSSRLQRVPVGEATLAVARYRVRYKQVGARRVGQLCESVVTRSVTLQ